VGKLDEEGRERFHREQMAGAEMLGLDRARIPPTVAELRAYIDGVVSSGILRVTDDTRKVVQLIRRPPQNVPWRPVLRQIAWWAFATLPEPLRTAYGVRWGPLEELRLRTSLRSLKLLRPLLPARFREILPARRAAERVSASAA
jgi:uncharacterized protein (DUF2236 family)